MFWAALRSVLVSTAVLVAYFVLPFTSTLTASTTLVLAVGLIMVAGLLVWQIRAIRVSRFPRARAFEMLSVTASVFFVVFATTYYLMGRAEPAHWSEPLSRLDALYFTVTTFATVGFGDISAVSTPARATVTVQIIGDLVVIGLVTRVVVRAVQEGLARRQESSR